MAPVRREPESTRLMLSAVLDGVAEGGALHHLVDRMLDIIEALVAVLDIIEALVPVLDIIGALVPVTDRIPDRF